MSLPDQTKNSQLSTRGKNKFRAGVNWGNGQSWDTEGQIRYLYFRDEGDGGIECFANAITGPEVIDSNTTNRIVAANVGQAFSKDGVTAGNQSLFVGGYLLYYNGTNCDRARGNDGTWPSVSGASGATILADPGVGNKWRIMRMVLTVDTAGLVTVSDGATLYKGYFGIGIPQVLDYSPVGKLQPTAHAAITMTNAGGGNVAADVVTAGKA